MPRYWLTTHWPPQKPVPNDTFHIHIQDKYKNDLSALRKGDKVVFYEFKTGPNATDSICFDVGDWGQGKVSKTLSGV